MNFRGATTLIIKLFKVLVWVLILDSTRCSRLIDFGKKWIFQKFYCEVFVYIQTLETWGIFHRKANLAQLGKFVMGGGFNLKLSYIFSSDLLIYSIRWVFGYMNFSCRVISFSYTPPSRKNILAPLCIASNNL